jgi:hypothetical protein
MPTGSLYNYALCTPVFRCNSSATTIECLIGIAAYYGTLAGGVVQMERVNPPADLHPSNGTGGMRYTAGQSIGGGAVLNDDLVELYYEPAYGLTGNFTIGYAITADSGDEQAFQVTEPTQADYRAVATLPRATAAGGNAAPLISQQVISFTFPMPSRRSTIFFGYKSAGGFANALRVGSYDAYSSPNYWVREIGGFVTTWHSTSASISASPTFARNGGTSALTITVPDSLRTLTASDLVVTGGTISNFARVS